METDFTDPFKLTLTHMFPALFKLLGLQTFRKSIHDFFLTNIVGEIQRRREGKITRPDVIQLLVQAKEGQLKLEAGDAEEISYTESKIKKISNWTDEDLAAQALVLFLGGFETLMQSISYELAFNPEIQQTLIDEVDKMLDMVVQETLRKWPSFRALTRLCTKDYMIKDDENGKTLAVDTLYLKPNC